MLSGFWLLRGWVCVCGGGAVEGGVGVCVWGGGAVEDGGGEV